MDQLKAPMKFLVITKFAFYENTKIFSFETDNLLRTLARINLNLDVLKFRKLKNRK